MASIIPLIYLLILGFFFLSGLVIAYHIWNFTLSRREAVATLTVFTVGIGVLLMINITFFLAIDWNSIFVTADNVRFMH